MVARLLYGFRVSIWFALALTRGRHADRHRWPARCRATSAARSISFLQRFIEIWGAVPELYLLIIFASIFEPSLLLLLVLLSLFGWIGLSDYVRAEFLRNREPRVREGGARAGPVEPARSSGATCCRIRMTPVITFLPFRMSAAILALTSLDFLGLGVPPSVPSLGELLKQGKDNLDAWWIIVPTFVLLVVTMLLLTFIGDALRDAFDTRKS